MRFDNPTAAKDAGIFAFWQTINFLSERSVAESIFFGREPCLCRIAMGWRPMKAQHGRDGASRHPVAHCLTSGNE